MKLVKLIWKLRTLALLIILACGAGILIVLVNLTFKPVIPGILNPVVFTKVEDGKTYFVNTQIGLQAVVFPATKLNYYYFTKAQLSLKDIALTDRLTVITNAGYFSGKVNDATHAGYLYNNGKLLSPTIAKTDKQITHVAVQYQNGSIDFIANSDFKLQSNMQLAFQSGPLFLNAGTTDVTAINNSSNGNSLTTRTFLGKTNNGQYFLGISRSAVTLHELAKLILNNPTVFGTTPSVLNLDGGSSTAMYVPNYLDFNFTPDWINPTAIGF